MVRSILIGLDGSAFSSSVTELGIQWAQRFDALLVGLGIIDEPTIRKPSMVPLGAGYYKQHRDDTLVARERRRVEHILEQFALRCAEAGVASKLLEDVGSPHEKILTEAQRYDLILLGQQTYFHPDPESGPCGTLHAVLKDTPRPVVAVPEKRAGGDAIVIAFDGSLPAARVLQAFQALGLSDSREIHVISVDSDQVEAARRADRAVEFLRFHDIAACPHALGASGSPANVILDQVRQRNAGLLVMGAYGRSTLREFFLGSVTRTILEGSTVPVFLYH